MEFLYPPPTINSHIILETVGNSIEYPKDSSYDKKFYFSNLENVPVCIIRENIGYKNEWAEVLVVNFEYSEYGYFKNKFYIKQSGLLNIKQKNTYKPLKQVEFNIDVNAEEIDPTLKEIYIPYLDKKNGLYSVRIQTDYDKVQEALIFAKLLEEVYMEGVKILLSSRGLRSDNQTINELKNKYYTFGYINKDLDLTIARPCESLTFTVSIPMNFFDTEAEEIKNIASTAIDSDIKPDIIIKFSNKDLFSKLGLIGNAFANRANDIIRLLYPNKFIEGFVLEIELASLKTFYLSASNLFEIIGFPLSGTSFTTYEIGLNFDRDLVKITIEKDSKKYVLPVNILSQFRMNGEFNYKRVFYYLENYEVMLTESINSDITDFIFRYVKYPNPKIVHEDSTINGKSIPDEVADQYRISFDEATESCLKLSDITGLVTTLADFTDVGFNLFITQKDKENNEIPSAVSKLKQNFKSLQADITSAKNQTPIPGSGDSGIIREPIPGESLKDIANGFAQAGANYAEKYNGFRTAIATLSYYCQRVNFNKILFSKILCYLKRLDPNDPTNPEVAKILSELPGDLINYANSLRGINRLSPTNFARALANGVNFDISLFCGKNLEAVYFLRGITKLAKTINIAGTQAIQFANTLADRNNTPNPWIGFANTLIRSFESALLNIVFTFLKEILMENCDNNPQDNTGNDYKNPFDSHLPIDRFGNIKESNNPEIIKANRRKILDTVFPPDGEYRKAVYGTDRTYEVNLIGQLLNDINCILTPQESVLLLLGKPSPQVEILIKNLVSKKYSTPPNDLRYITRDANYMKMFFKKLGLTIDQEFKTIRVPDNDNNPLTLSTLCKTTDPDEPVFKKVPINLGTLEERNIKLAKRAREMLEMIKDGKTVSVTAICSDEPDSDLSEAKENLLTTYREGIISDFDPAIIAFSEESVKLPENYSEQKNFYRRDGNSRLVDTIDYHSFNDNIARNLEDCKVENSKIYCLPKYMTPQGTEEIAKQQLASQASDVKLICPDSKFELSKDFEKVLENKQIVLEFAQDFLFDAEDGDLEDLYGETRRVARYLKDKKVTYTISLNKDTLQDIATLGFGSDADLIEFKIIYNDSTNNKFRILNQVGFQKDAGEIAGNKKYSSDKFYDNLSKNIDIEGRNELDDNDDVYFLDKDTFLKLGIEEKNLIQSVWTQKFAADLNRIKTYEEQIALINEFNRIGIFNIQKKGLEASINVATYDISSEQNTKNIIEKSYLDYYCGSFNIQDARKYFNVLYSILKDKKYAKYGFDKLQDLRYFDNSDGFLGFGAGNGEEVFPEGLSEANDYIEDSDYVIRENLENNFYLKQISKLSLFNYSQTPAQAACNVTPHYLNLEYFLNLSLDIGRKELCDDTLEMTPVNIMDDILVNLITRAHIADLLIKCLPALAVQNIDFLENLYKQDIFVDILSKFMKNEMSLYTPGSQKDNSYYRLFLERAEKVYIKHKQDNNLNKNIMDVSKTSLEYYIRREIRYFIKSCVEKGIFTPNHSSYDDIFIKNGINGKENLDNLYFTSIVYFLANNTVDYTKRIQFTRTLKELATIFFSNSKESSITADEADSFKNSNKSQGDVINFISNLAYSPNPAIMATVNPQYAKYLKYFLEESVKELRSTMLTIAQNGDPNIALTRKINFGLTTAAGISWVLLDQDQRNDLIYNNTNETLAVTWKRIDSGKSPSPDAVTSAGLMFFQIFPGPYGFAYLAIDSLLETKWYDKALTEIREAKKLKATDDPCAPAKIDESNQKVDNKCTIDKKAALLDELNATEISNKE